MCDRTTPPGTPTKKKLTAKQCNNPRLKDFSWVGDSKHGKCVSSLIAGGGAALLPPTEETPPSLPSCARNAPCIVDNGTWDNADSFTYIQALCTTQPTSDCGAETSDPTAVWTATWIDSSCEYYQPVITVIAHNDAGDTPFPVQGPGYEACLD